MELKRLCSRHLSLILFFVGIAVGLSAVFFVLKDNIHIVSEAKPKSDAQTTNRKAPKTQPSYHFASSKYHFRPFNPNSVSRKELLSFGLSEKQADNILNYRTKAGGFKNKEQFARLYCMQGGLFEQISPYLVFENQIAKSSLGNPNSPYRCCKTRNTQTCFGFEPLRQLRFATNQRNRAEKSLNDLPIWQKTRRVCECGTAQRGIWH